MSPDAAAADVPSARGPRQRPSDVAPHAGDAVDRARIQAARIGLGAIIGGGLWLVLGFEWIERVCAVQGCAGRAGLIGLPVAWAATGAVAGGRVARRFGWGTRVAGLALLVGTASAVTWPAGSAVVLAGPFLEALLASGLGLGFLFHWLLIGGLHVALWFALEQAGGRLNKHADPRPSRGSGL